MNIPNLLTLLRVLLIPVIVVVYYLPVGWSYMAAAGIFFIAGCTDLLDGYLARRWNQSTPFGAFLDPVADKLMVAVSLTLLVHEYASFWVTVPAMIIIGREIVISALREWMAELGKRTSVAVSYIGKIKTAAQMGAIFFLLATPAEINNLVGQIGFGFLYVAALLTIWSMWQYLSAAWGDLMPTDDQS
ncbi:CDP-diacylglycerol--glycerol-3-phosphate 3-phosphatidyltransferase [Aestuariirhabdus sp. Z084]|uniref:CDP-diacylglycerol--glycerol-3-phosphate 3-phosphatidyltransferase n=1 Tax=Aestuariirhabdus haliotis TaxID=2918751 RepID=UPI00201B3916|nr:CDP-diacylglycerol--glycerol-3-phosphate 3-phosphatidyltransferase [Aestuariirhabdus haliotis]MCL6414826.1 CDP-diacylglycerol--glycerol-3-phosphate 3-phosphatidyltransferase [Aestuariirhabdus haliotis]MCL6418758.1 CDP-diacylglycerol--glycerol-3-phosphate 3-phosphatidyltransferase [Aestuariirhabdus haliotis]